MIKIKKSFNNNKQRGQWKLTERETIFNPKMQRRIETLTFEIGDDAREEKRRDWNKEVWGFYFSYCILYYYSQCNNEMNYRANSLILILMGL